jgi:hypothetical protein
MHGVGEACASEMRQPSRVFLMCPCVRPRFGYPAVREGDRGAPPSVDATILDPHLVLYLQQGSTNFTSGWSHPI